MSNKNRIPPTRTPPELPPEVRRMLAEAERAKEQAQQQIVIVERAEYPQANFGFEFHDDPPRFVLTFLTPVGPGAGKETKFPFGREHFPRFVEQAQEFIKAVEKAEADAISAAAAADGAAEPALPAVPAPATEETA